MGTIYGGGGGGVFKKFVGVFGGGGGGGSLYINVACLLSARGGDLCQVLFVIILRLVMI